MKFGKLSNIDEVDFSLPPDRPESIEMLQSLAPRKTPPQVYVGCTGWGMKEWIGNWYPASAKSKDFLSYYGEQFNTIELNTTHYRTPNEKTIKSWKSRVPSNFRFAPKVLQSISHSKDLSPSDLSTRSFIESIAGLEKNLGCSFMQLPPNFSYDKLPMLEHFISKFPPEIPLAVELRDKSWFNEDSRLNHLGLILRNSHVSTVISDVSGRRDVLHMLLTTGTVIIRFVGNALHPTDYTRIDAWVERLKKWFDLGLREVYFFTHEPENILAPEIAVYFIRRLNERCGLSISEPIKVKNDTSQQISLF